MFEALSSAIDLALSYGVLIAGIGIASIIVVGAVKKFFFST